MKTKHQLTLNNYQTYGEGYNSGINYDEKTIKFVNYGRKTTTRPTERQSKAKIHALQKLLLKSASKAKIALCGASIVNGLQRYPDVWENFFAPLGAINLGIGGDKAENILWRMEDMELPQSVDYMFIHCGTNNIGSSSPNDIADGVLAIGVMAKQANVNLKIIIGSLLHCDKELPTRSMVAEVNKILQQKIRRLEGFLYGRRLRLG